MKSLGREEQKAWALEYDVEEGILFLSGGIFQPGR